MVIDTHSVSEKIFNLKNLFTDRVGINNHWILLHLKNIDGVGPYDLKSNIHSFSVSIYIYSVSEKKQARKTTDNYPAV